MKHIGGHAWVVTEPTQCQIGKPQHPPSPDVLTDIRAVVSNSGVTLVYWFWVSIRGEPPHLGLAVGPNDGASVGRMMQGVEPIWNAYSPGNMEIDVFTLGNPDLDAVILREGILLFENRNTPNSALQPPAFGSR
jgi:hypothetical protein